MHTLPLLVALGAGAHLLAGCGSDGTNARSDLPSLSRAEGKPGGFAELERRCVRLDRTKSPARIAYELHEHMTRGQAEPVTAAVTLDPSVDVHRSR